MQVSRVASSCLKYGRMQLLSYNMESRNSWDVNDDSKVIPCYEFRELNRLDS